MRSDPADYELIAPGNLQAVVSLLANEPGKWLPIAGGTDGTRAVGGCVICSTECRLRRRRSA